MERGRLWIAGGILRDDQNVFLALDELQQQPYGIRVYLLDWDCAFLVRLGVRLLVHSFQGHFFLNSHMRQFLQIWNGFFKPSQAVGAVCSAPPQQRDEVRSLGDAAESPALLSSHDDTFNLFVLFPEIRFHYSSLIEIETPCPERRDGNDQHRLLAVWYFCVTPKRSKWCVNRTCWWICT